MASRNVALLVALALLAAACAPAAPSPEGSTMAGQPTDARRGGVVRIAIYQEPPHANPLLGGQGVIDLVSRPALERLVSFAPDGAARPVLAVEVPSLDRGTISPDGLTITWKLRPGVVWSDGEPFTSRDVAFTHRVILDPANPVLNRTGYTDIESIVTPDDTTAIVRYRTVYAGFKDQFQLILPEHYFKGETGIETSDFNHAPVGTGPFAFKSWLPGHAITLERNPNYRDPGKPLLDGLVFKIVAAREIAIVWLKVHEIDAVWSLIEGNIPEIESIPDAVLDSAPTTLVERLILNTSCPSGPQQGDPDCPHPVLGDVRVRQAIELAIDKKSIVDGLLHGKASVATSLLPIGPYAVELSPSEHNPDRARRLLEDAGWRPGASGLRENGGKPASLGYSTTTGDNVRQQTQQLIQAQLRAVGIEVRIENLPSSVLFGSWQDNAPPARGNFDIVMWAAGPPAEPQSFLYNEFHSSAIPTDRSRGGLNRHRIRDRELDAALDLAGRTVDEAARKAAFRAALARIDVDKGLILLYNRLGLAALNNRVKGHAPSAWGGLIWDVQDWWLER